MAMLLVLGLSACATAPDTRRPDEPGTIAADTSSSDENTLERLLRQGETQPSPESEKYYLQAADYLVNTGRPDDAATILDSLRTDRLELALAAEIWSLRASIHLQAEQTAAALTILANPRLSALPQLPDRLQKSIQLLRADAYLASNDYLASVRELIYASHLFQADEIETNYGKIWSALMALPAEQLRTLAATSISFEFQGWFELGVIGKAFQNNLDRQVVELEKWQQTWAQHPAALNLPQAMRMVHTLATERPNHIALLLPLQTQAGIVIRDSFMSAYFDILSIGGKVPEIQFYDTTNTPDIVSLYDQAAAGGAEMIIGPLQKQHVSELLATRGLSVPTLMLNNVEGARPQSRVLYQFALSPENEARQVAHKAWQDGHQRVAILSPLETAGDDFYSRKRQSFIDEWQKLGGKIVSQEVFRDDYTAVIESLLDLGKSNYRRDQLSKLLGRPLVFTPRRRQDIDFIFLIAQPVAARQIKPTLAYLFAGDLPVYATQDVYSGTSRPLQDQDLNGIVFSESPWLLSSGDELRLDIQTLFPQNNSLYKRLQAFGIDAFRLYPRLKQLETLKDGYINGATGVLRMGQNRNIIGELSWARIENGKAENLREP
ncbi:MAG: penicillin-binding protein activator [Pseudomonadales bacterium]|nr:penicillin-binding protein activator [Pseudomonadales bacterium]